VHLLEAELLVEADRRLDVEDAVTGVDQLGDAFRLSRVLTGLGGVGSRKTRRCCLRQ
jgi:hypothetical protein